jgi:hypothetical protein
MKTITLYTIGLPIPELMAIRELIAQERDLDAHKMELYFISAKNDFGRVYYGAIDPVGAKGLVFVLCHGSRAEYGAAPMEASKWEVKDLQKYAHYLGIENLTVLPAIRLFEPEIQALTNY